MVSMNALTNTERTAPSKTRGTSLVAFLAALFAAIVLLLVAVESTDAQTTPTTGQEVWAWGFNAFGPLGDPTIPESNTPVHVSNLSDVTAIAGGQHHSLALKNDGTVRAWGLNDFGQLGNGTNTTSATPMQVSNLSGVTAIAGGHYHSLALKNDGTVRAWGANIDGQLG